MKLITYSRNNSISCGILTEGGVIDIPPGEEHKHKGRVLTDTIKIIAVEDAVG